MALSHSRKHTRLHIPVAGLFTGFYSTSARPVQMSRTVASDYQRRGIIHLRCGAWAELRPLLRLRLAYDSVNQGQRPRSYPPRFDSYLRPGPGCDPTRTSRSQPNQPSAGARLSGLKALSEPEPDRRHAFIVATHPGKTADQRQPRQAQPQQIGNHQESEPAEHDHYHERQRRSRFMPESRQAVGGQCKTRIAESGNRVKQAPTDPLQPVLLRGQRAIQAI